VNDDSGHLSALLEAVRSDGPVRRSPQGLLSIFDPAIAAEVESANGEALYVGDSLADLVKRPAARARVRWSDVRSVLIEQNRRLAGPRHVEALHERLRTFLIEQLDREQDATRIVGQGVAYSLVPLMIDGLPEQDLRLLKCEQGRRWDILLTPMAERITNWRKVRDFVRLQRTTRIISNEVRRRLNGASPPRDDFLEPLLAFSNQLRVRRISYLVTTLLAAASGAPESTACCLVYALRRHPEWHDRIAQEMAPLRRDDLYNLSTKKMPVTLRFIKEAMRLWSFPFFARRTAARDIKVDGVELREGDPYELSSYVLHHSELYWPDPEKFDPDRWLSPRKDAAKGTYVPFGFAPRSCVGGSVGHALLILICELFTRSFKVEMAGSAAPRLRMEGFAVPVGMTGTIRRSPPS
jgi:cytochrome P450